MPVSWHSHARMPQRYRAAVRIVDAMSQTPAQSLQSLIDAAKFPPNSKPSLAALVRLVLQKKPLLEALVKQSPLLDHMPKTVALVLVHVALFDHRQPVKPGCCPRFDQVLACLPQLRKALAAVPPTEAPLLPRYARVNTLLADTASVVWQLEALGFVRVRYRRRRGLSWFLERVRRLGPHEFLKDFHLRDWLVFGHGCKLSHLDLVSGMQLLLQDKASGMAVIALDPRPCAVLLDACAAPGMKASYAAALMRNTGRILAVDRCEERLSTLQSLVQHGGFDSICRVQRADFLDLDPQTQPYCDAELILVDPSCSGSGLCDRPGDELDPHSAEGVERLRRLSNLQAMLLKHATRFPRCQRIVYSTCSLYEQENEAVVAEVLDWVCGRFVLAHALPDLPTRGVGPLGEWCVRLGPKEMLTRGFFLAVLERPAAAPSANGAQRASFGASRGRRPLWKHA